ncbi:hypothetical protein SCALM49S_00231 [Streptomyces californicus]
MDEGAGESDERADDGEARIGRDPGRVGPAANPTGSGSLGGAFRRGASQEEEAEADDRARTRPLPSRAFPADPSAVNAVDAAVELAAFALSGKAYVAELRAGTARALPVPGPVIDPRPSPDGRHVAYVAKGALRVVGADGEGDRALAEPEDPQVTYGLAEFIAAEEMHRYRGFWWSPESDRLLVARADESPVRRWYIADPAHPDRKPAEVAYPAAGTPNADVRLYVTDLEGARTEVVWDRAAFPYLAQVHWSAAGAPLLLVQARDQRAQRYLAVDPESGATRIVHVDEDPVWLDLFPGVPAWAPDGRLVRIVDEGGARVLAVGDRPLTGSQLHVQSVLDIGESEIPVSAVAGEDAVEPEVGQVHVYRVNELGIERISEELALWCDLGVDLDGSPMMSPTVMRGFSEVYGSWKTIWMLRRTAFSARPESREMSSPL